MKLKNHRKMRRGSESMVLSYNKKPPVIIMLINLFSSNVGILAVLFGWAFVSIGWIFWPPLGLAVPILGMSTLLLGLAIRVFQTIKSTPRA